MFNRIYDTFISGGKFNESAEYYPRHKARYRDLMNIYASLRMDGCEVLDAGGKQYAILVDKIWGDKVIATDINTWDMTMPCPFKNRFNVIFFSEVLEHLPLPGYIVFNELKKALKPGGVIICTVPNLTSLENIYCFITGKRVFEKFQYSEGKDLGHVILYTKEHLQWQIEKAGFRKFTIKYKMLLKWHRNIVRNILFVLSFPLFIFPHFKTDIIAIIKKESGVC